MYEPEPCIEVTGIDGAGKSTVVAAVSAAIGWHSGKVRPFDPAAVSRDREIFTALGEAASYGYRSCALGAALLQAASQLTKPTVFDRYVESALMWWHVNETCSLSAPVLAALPPPSLVIFLDVPVGVGLARRLTSTAHSSEQEYRFMMGCRAYLSKRAKTSANWVRVDATSPQPDVLDACIAHARRAISALRPTTA